MQAHLRPLAFGEILDSAFTLYRRNFLPFLGTSAALSTVAVVVVVVVGGTGMMVIRAFGGAVALLAGVLMAAAVLGALMATWGALTWHAGRAYAGEKASVGEALEASVDSAMSLVGVAMLAMVLLLAAMVPGVLVWLPLSGMANPLPGDLLLVAWIVAAMALVWALLFAAFPAVVLEQRGPVQAVARSIQLSKGALGQITGVMIVALVITLMPELAVEALSGGSAGAPAEAAEEVGGITANLLSTLLHVLTAPFLASVGVVLYFDRRVRTEALDVQMMTDRLAVAGD